jgi:hypothetical protein
MPQTFVLLNVDSISEDQVLTISNRVGARQAVIPLVRSRIRGVYNAF